MRNIFLLLAELEDCDLDWLVACGRKQEVSQGARLLCEGKAIDAIHILLQGRMLILTEKNGRRDLGSLPPGAIIGAMHFFDASPSSVTIEAGEDCLVLSVPREQLVLKLASEIEFAARFYRILGMMLSAGLRRVINQFNHIPAEQLRIREEAEDEELAEWDQLDTINLAAARFGFILKRLNGD